MDLHEIRDHKIRWCKLDVAQTKVKRWNTSILHLTPVQVTGLLYIPTLDGYSCIAAGCSDVAINCGRTPVPILLQRLTLTNAILVPDTDPNADGRRRQLLLEHDYIDLELAVIDALLLNLPMRVVGEREEGTFHSLRWQGFEHGTDSSKASLRTHRKQGTPLLIKHKRSQCGW